MQNKETEDPQSDRIELCVTPQEKALLMRAVAIEHLDMASFVMRAAVLAAQEVIERKEYDTQQMQQAIDDNSQNTGEDLIAFFRNSPLAGVALELDLERDKATSRTITLQEIIERPEHIRLSERDSLLVMDLLENPPPPNAKLIAAAQALADNLKRLEDMQNDPGMV